MVASSTHPGEPPCTRRPCTHTTRTVTSMRRAPARTASARPAANGIDDDAPWPVGPCHGGDCGHGPGIGARPEQRHDHRGRRSPRVPLRRCDDDVPAAAQRTGLRRGQPHCPGGRLGRDRPRGSHGQRSDAGHPRRDGRPARLGHVPGSPCAVACRRARPRRQSRQRRAGSPAAQARGATATPHAALPPSCGSALAPNRCPTEIRRRGRLRSWPADPEDRRQGEDHDLPVSMLAGPHRCAKHLVHPAHADELQLLPGPAAA